MYWKRALAGTILGVLGVAAPAMADTFVVDTSADLAGTTCPQGACSIRRAIVAASQVSGSSNVIVIPQGEFHLDPGLGPLQITSEVSIAGAGARLSVIYAGSGSRVFQIAGTSASISHLTVRDGSASPTDPHGGNIKAQSSAVILDHVRVTNGSALSGGGVANRNGSMVIAFSLIDHNQALTGGGDGGGIINFGGDGGAAAQLTVVDSTIASNTARLVGGIIQYGNPGDSTTLRDVTLALNQTGDRGGPGNLSVGTETASLMNTILADSLGAAGPAPNCDGTAVASVGSNVADDASCNLIQPSDRPSVDARLYDALAADADGETDVIPFYPDSPARDLGGSCSPFDQTDSPRPTGAACDAGAWELPGEPVPPGPGDGTPIDSGPAPTPAPIPAARSTPPPRPVRNRSLAGDATTGTVLVKRPNGTFVPFSGGLLPNGTEVDATKGAIVITTAAGETATFSGGRFVVSQQGGLTTLTLSAPLDCTTAKRGQVRAAAVAKLKKRRLWGDGKGSFRTQGSYSAATVRGTKWLVEDTCTTTLTRVARGVVSVRDDVLRKTVSVRQGKSYIARAKRK
jgi:hypothetical protein